MNNQFLSFVYSIYYYFYYTFKIVSLGIYDICVLPPSIAHFEIECPCVTFISSTLLGGDECYMSSLARNISQSWAGNLVTCSNYEHLWLNKSFSIFIYRKIGCKVYSNYEEMNKIFQREELTISSMVRY